MGLDELDFLCKGRIKKINLNHNEKNRLYDLGFIEENLVIPLFSSPLKDPRAYLITDSIIALRKDIAKKIIIEEVYDEEDSFSGQS